MKSAGDSAPPVCGGRQLGSATLLHCLERPAAFFLHSEVEIWQFHQSRASEATRLISPPRRRYHQIQTLLRLAARHSCLARSGRRRNRRRWVDMPIQSAAGLPAIVLRAGTGASPDFAGTTFLVWDQNGNTYVRSNVISVTTWAAGGSLPTVARWQLSDALS
jgi:hypothetical protein